VTPRPTISLERLRQAPADALAELLADSEADGVRFVRRLLDEWSTGANRFGQPSEALFIARSAGTVVGLCGLNIDPYATAAGDTRVGRVRHLYVHSTHRGLGIGGRLVTEVVAAARGRFERLHLRTGNPTAAALYERLGFRRRRDDPHCTHVIDVEHDAGGAMKISQVIPQLRTTDLAASIRFYTEHVGFTLDFQYQDFYAGIRAGAQRVHLKLVDTRDPSIDFVDSGEHFHLYLETDDAAAAAERLGAHGVRLVKALHDTPWGTREFAVKDDQGHTLYVGERRDEA
jgi:ribosomal protein S18 acetylase RimI-like enzyme/catechol 2,3-dioxygenase-like lactoylglutathione lyase family enzyme